MKTPKCYTWLESCGSHLSGGVKEKIFFGILQSVRFSMTVRTDIFLYTEKLSYVLSFTLFLTLFNLLVTFSHLNNIMLIHKRKCFSSISPHVVICHTVHIWANTVLNIADLLLFSWHWTVWEGKVKIFKSVPSLGCIRWVRACIPAGKVWTWTGANRQLGAEALDHICKCITCSINFHHYHQTEVQPAGRSTWTHLHHLLHCHLNLFALWFRRSPAN